MVTQTDIQINSMASQDWVRINEMLSHEVYKGHTGRICPMKFKLALFLAWFSYSIRN